VYKCEAKYLESSSWKKYLSTSNEARRYSKKYQNNSAGKLRVCQKILRNSKDSGDLQKVSMPIRKEHRVSKYTGLSKIKKVEIKA
jgi:hypothetical protein